MRGLLSVAAILALLASPCTASGPALTATQ